MFIKRKFDNKYTIRFQLWKFLIAIYWLDKHKNNSNVVADTGDDEEGAADNIVVMQHTFALVLFSLFLAFHWQEVNHTFF